MIYLQLGIITQQGVFKYGIYKPTKTAVFLHYFVECPQSSSTLWREPTGLFFAEKGGSLAQIGTLHHVKRNEVSPVIPRLFLSPPGVLLIMAYTIRGGFTRKGSLLAAKTTFCLCIVKRLIVTLRCAVNVACVQTSPISFVARVQQRKWETSARRQL